MAVNCFGSNCECCLQGKELLAPGKSATAAEDKKVLIPVQVSSVHWLQPAQFTGAACTPCMHACCSFDGLVGGARPDFHVHVPPSLQDGSAELSVHVVSSSIAMLKGQKPPFLLLVRLAKRAAVQAAVQPLVTDAFVVS